MVPVELSKLAESVDVLNAEKGATLVELSVEVLAVEEVREPPDARTLVLDGLDVLDATVELELELTLP